MKKITVGLFFGKKDHILLWYFYHLVPSTDFNFIIKAVLKHHIKQEHFKINIYTDLTPLLEEDLNIEIGEESVQRNIHFTTNDDFLYNWINQISKTLRTTKIKQILTEELLYCLDLIQNGNKEETVKNKDIENNNQYPYPYPFYFPIYQYPPNTPNQNHMMQLGNNQFYNQHEQIQEKPTQKVKPNIQIDEDTSKVLKKLSGNALSKMGRVSFK